jgi:hypothetical protein
MISGEAIRDESSALKLLGLAGKGAIIHLGIVRGGTERTMTYTLYKK